MLKTLSSSIADDPLTPAFSRGRDRLHSAGSALGRAATGLVFVGALGATSTLLGPAGPTLTCALATLAIGMRFLVTARRRNHR